ncbi:MAG TPA: radical SAM protein [Candidatus Hydrogenedentes bacterium]|nr:radical SAM protein [Candidatus Hydrogenedentota bacterium]HPC17082.1 radical SAM protein [Candidatus Hydrogenedentota bacterium]HRT20535.1 radical SAM protein [Candidatus Hydrogenedentota bacterium]HRT65260.1 radical SAM protein [Candidatus Hydrogenedentota bacterium]
MRRILLVNPNRMLPPIAPIGLEYVAANLREHGFDPVLCDLAFAQDWKACLKSSLDGVSPDAVGVSIRNLDDAYFASQDFILEKMVEIIRHIRTLTDKPIILGGVGFSIAPREILRFSGADYGIAGDGEWAFPQLLECLSTGRIPDDVPGVVYWAGSGLVREVAPKRRDILRMPAPARRLADNARYFAEGGQAGIETRRGCTQNCLYCVDTLAKGIVARARGTSSLIAEIEDLLEQGIDVLHLCDSECNVPPEPLLRLCDALVQRGLGHRIRWYAYAAPVPFDARLARHMAKAGCRGINFGVDHGVPEMLCRLGRIHSPDDARNAARICRETGIACMFDMLFGGPGETPETLKQAIAFAREADPDCVGLSCGIRVYPHTGLARQIRAQGPLHANRNLHGAVRDNPELLRPIFYVNAAIGENIHEQVAALVDGDARFFHAVPSQLGANYNYNNNSVLAKAIRDGARGAYWDILRQSLSKSPDPMDR